MSGGAAEAGLAHADAAERGAPTGPPGESFAAARRVAGELLSAYGQVLFAHDAEAGHRAALVIALATFTLPRVGAAGLVAVLVASGLVRLAHLDAARAARGHYGYNALLAGLAVGALLSPAVPTLPALGLVTLAATAALLGQAALESTLGALLQLPSLTLPFVGATLLALAAAPHLAGVSLLSLSAARAPTLLGAHLPSPLGLALRSLGALFFVPTELAGALVLVGLVAWSRIGALLALTGIACATAMVRLVGPPVLLPGLDLAVGYNGAVAALALGGIWFVPQRSSFVLAAVAAALSSALALALAALLLPLDLPVLILPFNLTALTLLLAMRQRVRDGSPKVVDFLPGTPEANLNYYRTRLARFGQGLTPATRFRLPFHGRRVVTQGEDGAHTHRGQWRHALDFEATADGTSTGARHAAQGNAVTDYYGYGLPVLACADGTVVKVRGDVLDNLPCERNGRDPWGNVVVLRHGPALFSVVAHLQPGSVAVVEGQAVLAGAQLGACGNSGRSFQPHLHFQLQAEARLGAPTLELALHDVVREAHGDDATPSLHRAYVPRQGEVVRGVEPRADLAAVLDLPLGTRLTFELDDAGAARRETVRAEIDLWNASQLVSEDGGGRLFFEHQPHQLVVFDHVGPASSVLHWIYAALPRAPFELGVAWEDVLPSRWFRPRVTGALHDLVDPFLVEEGQPLGFTSRREGAALVIRGAGVRGGRAIETRARFVPGLGLTEVELRVGGVVRRACVVERSFA